MGGDLEGYLRRTYGIGSEEEKKKLNKKKKGVRRLGNFSLVDDDQLLVHSKLKKEKNLNTKGENSERKLMASGGWTSSPLDSSETALSSSQEQEKRVRSSELSEVSATGEIHNSGQYQSFMVDEDGDVDFSLHSRPGTTAVATNSDNMSNVEPSFKKSVSGVALKVGLQSAEDIKVRNRQMKRAEVFEVLPEQESMGEHAGTVFRDQRGKILGSYEEFVESRKRKSHFRNEPEYTWGAGIVQKQIADEERERLANEKVRDFAVYKTDKELNERQRQQMRWGDPLLSQIYHKQKNISQLSNKVSNLDSKDRSHVSSVTSSERYQGPPPPPNRFNIEPGPRWDGIDRSNGFERKVFDRVSKKVAMEELAYKMSVEDM